MGVIQNRVLTLLVLGIGGLPAVWAAEPDSEAARIERSIEQAREQLDEAARKLAELHSQMWHMETAGPRSERPMLGILVDDAGADDGLTLAGVTPAGGAEQAGLKAGDRIIVVNGERMDGGGAKRPLHLLAEAMSSVQAGASVPVTFVRDGETLQADILTRQRGSYMAKVMEEQRPWLESLRSLAELEDLEALQGLEELEILKGGKLDLSGDVMRVPAGLKLEDVSGSLASYFDVDRGVLVLETPDDELALKAGDILLEIDGQAVASADAALERLAGLEGSIATQIKRDGRVQKVDLDVDALNANQALHVMRGDRRIRIQRRGEGDQVQLEISVDD
jgi:S1-C subfamily serine protease